MAYITRIAEYICGGTCNSKAIVEVFGADGSSFGYYCAPHGKTKLRKVQKREEEESAVRPGIKARLTEEQLEEE